MIRRVIFASLYSRAHVVIIHDSILGKKNRSGKIKKSIISSHEKFNLKEKLWARDHSIVANSSIGANLN
jgi:hypothetical protein